MKNKASKWQLFHTQGCHLCELGEAVIMQANIPYQLQDICDDPLLVKRYGSSIPVLASVIHDRELLWPFDVKQVIEFVGG